MFASREEAHAAPWVRRLPLRADFVRHGAVLFGAAMATNGLNYLFNVVLSRRLGVEGFAALSSLTSVLVILSIPAVVLSLIVVRYVAVFHATGDGQRTKRFSQCLLKITFAGSMAMFGIGALLRAPIGSFLKISDSTGILTCLGIVAVLFLSMGMRSVLQGEQDFTRFSISTVLEALLKFGFAFAFVYAGLGVMGAMLGWFIGSVCSLCYTLTVIFQKHLSVDAASVHLKLDVPLLARTTAGIACAVGFLTLMSFMDILLVKHYFDARQAGLYAAVNLTGKIVLFLVAFVPALLLPKAVARDSRGQNAQPLLLQAAGITLGLSGAVLVVFGLFPAQLVHVLAGQGFVSAAPYVLEYDASACMLALVTLLVNYRIAIHSFGFLYALGGIVVCEAIGIAAFHASLWDVIHVLLAGNFVAVVVCGYGAAVPLALAARRRRRRIAR